MAEKKFFVDVNLQGNNINNLKADTLDITSNLASANTKRIVYWSDQYYYSNGTSWIALGSAATNGLPTGGTTDQVLAKASNSDYDSEWKTLNVADTGLTLTTTGTSGASTLIGNTLNIPQYSGGGGTVNIKRHDYSAPYDYNAFAPQGTLDTDTTWTITRLTINADGTYTSGVATGAWTNRTNLTYN
jgi:hypothetical protein